MRKRARPIRTHLLRQAAVARLGREFRMLVVRGAGSSPGEPADVAKAIARAYEDIQRRRLATAARMHPYEVHRLTESALGLAAKLSAVNIDVQRPAILEHGSELREQFAAELIDRWGSGLDELRLLHEVAWEAGSTFHHEVGAPTALHEVLARLHARGLAIGDEILCLLRGGFASGAMARWRTLHEIRVIAAVVADGGEGTARRYLDHQAISCCKHAEEYERRAGQLGMHPVGADELGQIRAARDDALKRYGKAFKNDYGWVNAGGDDRRLTFRDLEAAVGQADLRPYYQLANHPVHVGSHGLLWEIGSVDDRVLITGPSDRGLADPGQLAAMSLLGLTRSFVLSARDVDVRWFIYIDVLEVLARRVAEALHRGHVTWEQRPTSLGPVVSAGVHDAQSLLAWPALEPEDYGRIFTGALRRIAFERRRRPAARRPRRRVATRMLEPKDTPASRS